MRRITQLLLIGAAGVVLSVAALFGYLSWISGPALRISSQRVAPGVEVDTRFLGDYHLGLSRLVVTSRQTGERVVELRSEYARIPNVFRLVPGVNRLEPLTREAAEAALEPFSLERGLAYSLEVCGNDGFGRVRCASGDFEL